MQSLQTSADRKRRWYLNDRPIDSVSADRLGSASVAKTIVKAIESVDPPCMIGLMGGFGSGKSSVTRLASSMLDRSHFDSVTVSADKHSGSERARNLVHAIAGEMVDTNRIDRSKVDKILRPLRQATQDTAPNPTDTTWARMRSGKCSLQEWLKVTLPPLLIGAGLASLGLVANTAAARTGWSVAGGVTTVGLLVAMVLSDWAAAVRGLNVAAMRTEQTPRAEAADEIEEVFGQLVDLHKEEHPRRRLVVFVDDIDRLSKDDLLDALRSLRSLQSVPRGAEPIFVISCDEAILRSAVKGSLSHPATASEETAPAGTATITDTRSRKAPDTNGSSDGHEASQRDFKSEHDHPALAFVDKLLTVRVQMPPTMGGDMRRFAQSAIGKDHPLRKHGLNIERLVPVLIHDGVSEPRSAIRLLNRFIAAYLLATERERDRSAALGDITDHAGVLAQLCVLLDEYPQFHEEIAANTMLLYAAHKLALRRADLTDSEGDALRRSAEFTDGPPFDFAQQSLRRYLAGTANRVVLPSDIGPLIYFTDTPGGRNLGAQLRSEIVSGVASGDHVDLAGVLDRVPADKVVDAAGEIKQKLHDASPVDASTYVPAVAPNLHRLKDSAEGVADACADLLDRAPDASIPAAALTEIISHTVPERNVLLCERLVRADGDTDSTNIRMVHAAEYMTGNPQIRRLVEPAITEWVKDLPGEGSWSLARTWLGVGEALNGDEYKTLRSLIAASLVSSVRSEAGFSTVDADRLVRLAETSIKGDASASPLSQSLAAEGPNTRNAFVRLWDVTASEGSADSARFAAETAADRHIDPQVRQLAIRQTAAWVGKWKDAEWDTEEEAAAGEIPDLIVGHLTTAALEPATLPAIADVLPNLAGELGPSANPLLSQAADAALALAGGDPASADRTAISLIETVAAAVGTEHEGQFDQHALRLFDAVDSGGDPSDPAVQMAVRLIPVAARTAGGRGVLGSKLSQWSGSLIGRRPGDNRASIDALRAAFEADPVVVQQHAQPQTVLDDTSQRIESGRGSPEMFRTLTCFPWPDEQVEPALSAIGRHWDILSEDAQLEAIEVVSRASDEFDLLHTFHNRIAKIVWANPRGAAGRIAAGETARMDLLAQALVFGSAVGKHDAVTSAWTALDADTVAKVIVENAGDVDAVNRLLQAPPARRHASAGAALSLMASTADMPETAVQAVSGHCNHAGLTQASQIATGTLADGGPQASSALRVVIAARENRAEVDTDRIQELAKALLPDATPEIVQLLGRSLNGIRQSRGLKDTLNGLRRDANTKSIAGAFDAAYTA